MDKQKYSKEEIQRLRKDPKNIKWGAYSCPEDPYLVVPKGIKWMGWTFNFAHPKAGIAVIGVTLFSTVPTLLAICSFQTAFATAMTLVFVILALCLWSHKEATKYE